METQETVTTPKSDQKIDFLNGQNLLNKLDTVIQENQTYQGEQIKIRLEAVHTNVREYFVKLSERVQKQINETQGSILKKIEVIVEQETGFTDWEKFKEQLSQKQIAYEQITDVIEQKKVFDEFFNFYSSTMKRIDSINKEAYYKLDTTTKLFKFDDIVLESFLMSFKSLCSVLESDFVTNVSFTANHVEHAQIRLEELLSTPLQGVRSAIEAVNQSNAFVVGGRDGRIAMHDSKTLRVLDTTQVIKGQVTSLLHIPQKAMLLIGGEDNRIAVRRIDAGSLGQHLSYIDAQGSVSFMFHVEDEEAIASVGSDPNIRLYHAQSLVNLGKISTRKGMAPRESACYFKDKRLLMLGFEDGIFQFYNMRTRQLVFGIFIENKPFWGLTYDEPSERLFAHIQPGLVKVWKFKGERPLDEFDVVLEGEGDKPYHIKVVDKYLVSANNSERVMIYDLEEKKLVKRVEIPGFKAQGLLVLEKERRIVVTDEDNSKLAILKLH